MSRRPADGDLQQGHGWEGVKIVLFSCVQWEGGVQQELDFDVYVHL